MRTGLLTHLLQQIGGCSKIDASIIRKCARHGRDPIVSRPQFIDCGPRWINPGRDTIESLPCFAHFVHWGHSFVISFWKELEPMLFHCAPTPTQKNERHPPARRSLLPLCLYATLLLYLLNVVKSILHGPFTC